MHIIPKRLTRSKYRKNLWRNAQRVIRALEKALPIAEIHLMGSFATKKKRPADVDFIVMLETKESRPNARWSVDLVTAPHNKHGQELLRDNHLWMKQKYGSKNFLKVALKSTKKDGLVWKSGT